MERQFFSGNSVEQAILAAARHYGLDPSRVAYKLRDKKHGFVNIRRRVVIEVDPAAPEQPEEQQPPPAEAQSSTSRNTDRRPAPRREAPRHEAPRHEAPRHEAPRYEAPRHEVSRHQDRQEMRWRGAEVSWDGEGDDREVAAIEKALEEIAQLLGLRLELSIEHGEDGFEIDLSGDGSDSLLDDRGQALDAIEHLLPRMVRGLLGHGIRCRIDCGGFRATHETELRQLAEEAAEDVRRELRDQMLEPMNPADRRLVHMALAEDPTVETESEGQGFMKRVRISPA